VRLLTGVCHSERSEESAVAAGAKEQIPPFGRNDKGIAGVSNNVEMSNAV
jgi:hypothetical protein